MAKYFVKMDDLNEEGKELSRYASEQIDSKIDELLALGDQLKWTGPVFEGYTDLYKERTSKLRYASKMIETYGKFMSMASDGFNDVNNQIEKMADDFTKTVQKASTYTATANASSYQQINPEDINKFKENQNGVAYKELNSVPLDNEIEPI